VFFFFLKSSTEFICDDNSLTSPQTPDLQH